MSTQNQDRLTEFLTKHDYIVKCSVVDNTVECYYKEFFKRKYMANVINEAVYDLHIYYGEEYVEALLLNTAFVRWYIFLDIIRLCRKNKLSHNIIRFFDKDGAQYEFDNIFKMNMSEDQLLLENKIGMSVISILNDPKKLNEFDKEYLDNGNFYSFSVLKGLLA